MLKEDKYCRLAVYTNFSVHYTNTLHKDSQCKDMLAVRTLKLGTSHCILTVMF